MFSLKNNLGNTISAGISLSSEGISLAVVENLEKGSVLKYAQFHDCSPNDQSSLMSELVRQHKLNNIPCNLVLLPEEYQLTQIDAPEVPKQELSAALHWQIKDLIDFHIDDAVIDHINLPNESASGKKQLLVVASRRSVIQSHVDLLRGANCRLTTIDVAIQSARNIISHIPSDNNSIGLLNLWDNLSKLSVILNNDIYINRSSSIGLQSLSFVSEDDLNSQSILDSLALELQRTFDYYESHSRQATISHLLILNNGKDIDNLDQLLQQRLGIKCINIELNDALTFSDSIDHVNNKCITAIGGALRNSH